MDFFIISLSSLSACWEMGSSKRYHGEQEMKPGLVEPCEDLEIAQAAGQGGRIQKLPSKAVKVISEKIRLLAGLEESCQG